LIGNKEFGGFFRQWELEKMKRISIELKERRLKKGEILAQDGQVVDYLIFFAKGKVAVEKNMQIKSENNWPVVMNLG